MKKICAVGVAFLLASVCVESSAQVFCWNLENYFDWRDDPVTLDEPFTPSGEYHWNRKKFYAKRNAVAKTVIASAEAFGGRLPAVVGLCEVENRWVLESLLNETVLSKCGYGYLHRESPDPRGIDVALLYDRSRCRLLESGFLRVEEFATRDIIFAKLDYDGDTLFVFLNHWPSKYGGAKESDPKREAVARILAHKADSVLCADPDARIVMMGDFNDTPEAEVCRRLCDICHLVNLSEGLTGGTIRFNGRWEMIDQMMVSPALAAENPRAEVYMPDFLLEADRKFLGVKPRRTNIGPRYNGGVSDHLPVLLHLGE